CFITVDGRGKNRGLSLSELSILCADMGMAAAYNMDGGASSAMYFNGNSYGLNGRETSDIVYIVESGKEN
ncbi:MAG: phosphodiester glycosidase family protein, partial [Clostridia bacterium]|nr:phosphodiester glycosidase family protein [Clostridia bacterium]